MNWRVRKIGAWTAGMALVGFILGSKGYPPEHLRFTLGGAGLGFILGVFFSVRLPNSK